MYNACSVHDPIRLAIYVCQTKDSRINISLSYNSKCSNVENKVHPVNK